MKAAILTESRKPLTLADLAVPEKLTFGQVHVKVHYSGICGAQINEIDAVKAPDKYLPHLLGHEGVGTVLRTGDGVTRVKQGDLVVLHWRPAAGLQCQPPSYDWNGTKVNSGWVTTFNEETIASENRLTPIPDTFDKRQAPLFGCAVTTAVGVINNDAHVRIGESVLVFGAGGVGLNIIQAAKLAGAYPIIAVDLTDEKLKMAGKWGASHTCKPDEIEAFVQDIALGAGVDVAIDTTGLSPVIEQAYGLTHADGRTILVGVPKDKVTIYTLPLHFKKVLTGSHGGSIEPDVTIPKLIRLVEAGRMTLDGLVTHEYPLVDINEAIHTMRTGAAGRILIRM